MIYTMVVPERVSVTPEAIKKLRPVDVYRVDNKSTIYIDKLPKKCKVLELYVDGPQLTVDRKHLIEAISLLTKETL